MKFIFSKSILPFTVILSAFIFILPSCEKDYPNSNAVVETLNEEIDVQLPSEKTMQQFGLSEDELNAPQFPVAPIRTDENSAEIILRNANCLQYNSWNYFQRSGWIYVYEYPATWVWSDKFQDFIYMTSQSDVCDYGFLFHTNNPICGLSGWMWDDDASSDPIWYWENGWTTFYCLDDPCTNNDFSNQFVNYAAQYSYLENTADCCGAVSLVTDLTNFRDLVDTGQPLDIKNTDPFLVNLRSNGCPVQFFGREVAVDVPGNVLYGYIGQLYWKNKYPENSGPFLKAASGLAQGILEGDLDGGIGTTGLLAFQDEWLCLTSFDQWCDTYAIGLGVKIAETYGANATYNEILNEMDWNGAYLYEADLDCTNSAGQNAYSPTGLVDCGPP